jgi:hypothetical protein
MGVKRIGREADHSLPSTAELKNSGAILPLQIRHHVVMLNELNSRDNFCVSHYRLAENNTYGYKLLISYICSAPSVVNLPLRS